MFMCYRAGSNEERERFMIQVRENFLSVRRKNIKMSVNINVLWRVYICRWGNLRESPLDCLSPIHKKMTLITAS